KRIALIQGHPDNSEPHLLHALALCYSNSALTAGHAVKQINIAELDFPLLRSQKEWQTGQLPESLQESQEIIRWADHLILFYPLWLGDMPALLKGFLEQIARPGFAFKAEGDNPFNKKGLTGRSARVVVTMGMPALVYRYFFRAHSLKSLERNILGFVGIAPVHETLIGAVENADENTQKKWFKTMEKLGRQGN
ncbi:MAG TPA: NAD(P)H-dependent oxidoreductase, partial [Pseudomonadales bacterium]|nr:NAD(P)H-dependent oxidoreductase [Pseudomonadales bacterium]